MPGLGCELVPNATRDHAQQHMSLPPDCFHVTYSPVVENPASVIVPCTL